MFRNSGGGYSKYPNYNNNSQGNSQNFRNTQTSSGFGGGNGHNNSYRGNPRENNNFANPNNYHDRPNSNQQINKPGQNFHNPNNRYSQSNQNNQNNGRQNFSPNPNYQPPYSQNSFQGRQNNVYSPQSHQNQTNTTRHFGTVKPSANQNKSFHVGANSMAIENENTSTQNSFHKPQPNNTQTSGIFANSQNHNDAIWNRNNNQGNFTGNSQKNGSWGEGGNISHSMNNNSYSNQNKVTPWAQNNNQRDQSNESIGNRGEISHLGNQPWNPSNKQGNLNNNSGNQPWNQQNNQGNQNNQTTGNNFGNQNTSIWGQSTNNTLFAPKSINIAHSNPITNNSSAFNSNDSMTHSNPIISNPNPKTKYQKFKGNAVDSFDTTNNVSQNFPAHFGGTSNIFHPSGNSNNSSNSNNGFGNEINEPMRPRGGNDAESAFARRFWNDGAERLDKAKLYNNLDEKKKNEIIDSFLN